MALSLTKFILIRLFIFKVLFMIRYITGNLFDSDAVALVNTVNTQGVMGKGIALQFKELYHNNYLAYRNACKRGEVVVGKMFITDDFDLSGKKRIIINFPTKKEWRRPSQYSYISEGLKDLRNQIIAHGIPSIAIPPLGSNNGGLEWTKVKPMIESSLAGLPCDIIIYEPTNAIKEKMRKERKHLTPARAMLLSVMADMYIDDETPSEFAAEKIAYFLQKFGARDQFKLTFKKGFYGPYSGKVRYVLHYLEGSYIMGMASMSNHPFDEIQLTSDAGEEANKYLNQQSIKSYKEIAERTKTFLRGYYSNYLLELLATTSFLMDTDPEMQMASTEEQKVALISRDLMQWSNRKERLFNSGNAIRLALHHLSQANLF